MAAVFVLEQAAKGATPVSDVLRREGFYVLSLPNADDVLEALGCVRADMLIIDARAASSNYERLLAELCHLPVYDGLPVLVLGTRVAEYRRLGTTMGPVEAKAKMGDDPLPLSLLEHVRGRLLPLSEPFN